MRRTRLSDIKVHRLTNGTLAFLTEGKMTNEDVKVLQEIIWMVTRQQEELKNADKKI